MPVGLRDLEVVVCRRPRAVDRVWSWAFAARMAALEPLLSCPGAPACCFDWIEREMAWACEDLEDAGAWPRDLDLPAAPVGEGIDLVVLLLARLAACDADDMEDGGQRGAVTDAAARARACLAALLDDLPPARAAA